MWEVAVIVCGHTIRQKSQEHQRKIYFRDCPLYLIQMAFKCHCSQNLRIYLYSFQLLPQEKLSVWR